MKKLIVTLVVGLTGIGCVNAIDFQPVQSNETAYVEKTAATATQALRQKTRRAIEAIKDKDFHALSQLVDPQGGLRFAPGAYRRVDSLEECWHIGHRYFLYCHARRSPKAPVFPSDP